MGALVIALCIIALSAVKVPVVVWVERAAGGRRWRPPPPRPAHGFDHLPDTLVELGRCTLEIRSRIASLESVSAEFRRSLPFLDLFFAPAVANLRLGRARWVRQARESYEIAVHELGASLAAWFDLYEEARMDGRRLPCALVGAAQAIGMALEDPRLVPQTAAQAFRIRFSESPDVDRRDAALREIDRRLADAEDSLRHGGPWIYR